MENEKIGACNHSPNEGRFLYDSRTILNVCFPISPRILARASILGDISGTFGDVGYSKWLIASSILISLAIAIVFMIVTALFITCAFWTVTLLAVLLGLIVGAISVLFAYSISYNQSLLSLFGDFTSRYSGQLLFLEGHITWVWVVGIILLLTTLLALILICIYRESISIELGVLDVNKNLTIVHSNFYLPDSKHSDSLNSLLRNPSNHINSMLNLNNDNPY